MFAGEYNSTEPLSRVVPRIEGSYLGLPLSSVNAGYAAGDCVSDSRDKSYPGKEPRPSHMAAPGVWKWPVQKSCMAS